MLAVIFLILITASVWLGKLPIVVLWFYLAASIITFLFYAIDKSAAKQGLWRTPENTLHLLALAGGWPGALVAQKWLRHKSKKPSFQLVFWVSVVINCAALAWFFYSYLW
jgi:uncharacterized membrane protein YsdA (DUF1294 family)